MMKVMKMMKAMKAMKAVKAVKVMKGMKVTWSGSYQHAEEKMRNLNFRKSGGMGGAFGHGLASLGGYLPTRTLKSNLPIFADPPTHRQVSTVPKILSHFSVRYLLRSTTYIIGGRNHPSPTRGITSIANGVRCCKIRGSMGSGRNKSIVDLGIYRMKRIENEYKHLCEVHYWSLWQQYPIECGSKSFPKHADNSPVFRTAIEASRASF